MLGPYSYIDGITPGYVSGKQADIVFFFFFFKQSFARGHGRGQLV